MALGLVIGGCPFRGLVAELRGSFSLSRSSFDGNVLLSLPLPLDVHVVHFMLRRSQRARRFVDDVPDSHSLAVNKSGLKTFFDFLLFLKLIQIGPKSVKTMFWGSLGMF